jgi:predicted ArsR family transcriptional regulator
MSTPTMPLIAQFLAARPRGSTGAEIAAHLGTTERSAAQSLTRLLERGEVHRTNGSTRAEAVWSLTKQDETPPIYSAMQTVEAMRAVAHRVFAEHADSLRPSRETAKCIGCDTGIVS